MSASFSCSVVIDCGTVGRVEHAARVRLERDERGGGAGLCLAAATVRANDVEVAVVDAVEAADGDAPPDRSG